MVPAIEISRAGAQVEVAYASGAQPFTCKLFNDRAEAEAFVESKLGKRSGMIINNLDITAEQIQRQAERKARLAALYGEARSS